MSIALKNGKRNFATVAAGLLLLATAATEAAAQSGRAGGGYFGGYGRQDRDRGGSDVVRDDYFEARLETDRTNYPSDRGVEIRIRVANTADRGRSISSGSRDLYVVEIRDDRTGRVVRELKGRGFLRLESGQDRSFREVWDQRDSGGRYVPGGTYRVEVRTFGTSRRLNTKVYLSDRGGRGDDRDEWDRDRPGNGRPGNGRPGGWDGRPWPGGNDSSDYRSVRGELSIDRGGRVRTGDRVRFTFNVTNTDRNDSRTFRFSSGRQSEFEVVDSRGRVVWRSSEGMMHGQALTEFTLRPGERKTFSANWRVPDNVREGTYEVRAYLPTRGGDNQAATTRLRFQVEE